MFRWWDRVGLASDALPFLDVFKFSTTYHFSLFLYNEINSSSLSPLNPPNTTQISLRLPYTTLSFSERSAKNPIKYFPPRCLHSLPLSTYHSITPHSPTPLYPTTFLIAFFFYRFLLSPTSYSFLRS